VNPADKRPITPDSDPESARVRIDLRGRHLMIFLLAGTAILLASLFAVSSLSRLNDQMDQIVQRLSDKTRVIAQVRQSMLLMRVQEKNFMSWSSEDQLRDFENRLRVAEAELDRGLRELERITDAQVAERVAGFRSQYDDFHSKVEKVADLARTDTLRQAVELVRGRGADLHQQARLVLLGMLERHRAIMAKSAADGASTVPELEQMAMRSGTARKALETLHEMRYLEHAALLPLNPEDRSSLVARLAEQEASLADSVKALAESTSSADSADMERLSPILKQWTANSAEVRRLALEDTKGEAMSLSTSVVRQAYLDSSDTLDSMLQQAERQMEEARAEHSKTLNFGRTVVMVCGMLGVCVVGGLLVLLLQQIVLEYRRAADPFVDAR
jgi:CHASE3 domain sensor protein